MTVAAELLFADPVADIAVLGQPDGQELHKEADAYDALLENRPAFRISDSSERADARVLTLNGQWTRCIAEHIVDGPLWLSEGAGFAGGMSGSPILKEDGAAIGVFVCSSGHGPLPAKEHTEGGPNPRLVRNLPGWMLPPARGADLRR